MASDALPDWSRHTYATDLVPGLKEVLSLDLRETVVTFRDEHVERYGGAADLRRAGRANLQALHAEDRRHIQTPDGAHFDFLLGQSVYTAGRALVTPELADLLVGAGALPHGVLVGIASRHQVAVHVIRDGSVLPTPGQLARFVQLGYDDRTAVAYVYWWPDDRWEQVTNSTATGLSPRISADFNDVLEEVTGSDTACGSTWTGSARCSMSSGGSRFRRVRCHFGRMLRGAAGILRVAWRSRANAAIHWVLRPWGNAASRGWQRWQD